jgi:hypothetical protein
LESSGRTLAVSVDSRQNRICTATDALDAYLNSAVGIKTNAGRARAEAEHHIEQYRRTVARGSDGSLRLSEATKWYAQAYELEN